MTYTQCWGKGYYGETGLESFRAVGVRANEMGDNLPELDLSSDAAATASSSDTPDMMYLSAGGHRTCAISSGVRVSVRNYATCPHID